MNPLAIRARNYRGLHDFDIQLLPGCTVITGANPDRNNGHRKTRTVEAIDVCLFGSSEPKRSWLPYVTYESLGGGTEMTLELEFEQDGDVYRIRRHYSTKRGGDGKLDLERYVPEESAGMPDAPTHASAGWETLTLDSQKETQRRIEQITGLDRDTYLHSVRLVQDGPSLPNLDRRDRQKMLAKTVRLDEPWEKVWESVKRDLRAAERELAELDGKIAAAQERLADIDRFDAEIARLADESEQATLACTDLEQKLAGLRARAAQEQSAVETRKSLAAAAQAAARALADHDDRGRQAAEAADALRKVEEALAQLPSTEDIPALEQEVAEHEAMVAAYRQALAAYEQALRDHRAVSERARSLSARAQEIEARAAAITEQIAAAESGELEACPVCKQTLGADARAETIEALTRDAVAATDEAKVLRQQADAVVLPDVPPEPQQPAEAEAALAALRDRLARARTDAVQRARLSERADAIRPAVEMFDHESYKDERARLAAAAAEAERARAAVPDVADPAAAARAVADADTELQAARITAQRLRDDLVRARTTRDWLEELRQQVAADERERETIAERIDTLAELQRHHSPDGFRSWVLSQHVLPQLEQEATRALEELERPGWHIELRTEKELRSGDMAAALDIVVVTELGEQPYGDFSDGEKTRINLALRVGLYELLLSRRHGGSRVLILDEPKFLDLGGHRALARLVRRLYDEGKVERVLLISHDPSLRDAPEFDHRIEVSRDSDGLSRVSA